MSELNNATAPESTTERYAREVAHRATPAGAREALERDRARGDDQIAANLRESWGGDDSGVNRALAASELTHERLRVTDEQAAEAERFLGRQAAAELKAKIGESLALIDPATTPAEAREMIAELRSDPDWVARHAAGDRRARKLYDGLNWILARGGQ